MSISKRTIIKIVVAVVVIGLLLSFQFCLTCKGIYTKPWLSFMETFPEECTKCGFKNEIDQTKVSATRTLISTVATCVKMYEYDKGRYPDNLESLIGYNGFTKDWLYDSWDTPLEYQVKNKMFYIQSAGPDKKFNTGDDIHY